MATTINRSFTAGFQRMAFVRDQLFIPPFPASIPELIPRVCAAINLIDGNMLTNLWDIYRVTKRSIIEFHENYSIMQDGASCHFHNDVTSYLNVDEQLGSVVAVGSLVVRASDSRLKGLGSMLDVTKYPPSAHGFTCRNCGGGDRGRVAIYRPFGEVSLSLNRTVTCMVLKANDRRTSCPCHDEFRGPRSDYVRQDDKRKIEYKTKNYFHNISIGELSIMRPFALNTDREKRRDTPHILSDGENTLGI
ncbi:uncharacterized protein TNCV_1814441 [Trichonephila clavipes]|nr:uncharacterized protein TNCV_1814441 [Trichonephila clavipes]